MSCANARFCVPAPLLRLRSRIRRGGWRSLTTFVAGAAVAAGLAFAPLPAEARRFFDSVGVGTVRAANLPLEGRQVLAAIEAGGPFAFRRDGIQFGNREGILPRQSRGYYAEYTVPTPGASNRGARRIIAGRGATGDFRTSNEYYYCDDHYQSFRRIVQ